MKLFFYAASLSFQYIKNIFLSYVHLLIPVPLTAALDNPSESRIAAMLRHKLFTPDEYQVFPVPGVDNKSYLNKALVCCPHEPLIKIFSGKHGEKSVL